MVQSIVEPRRGERRMEQRRRQALAVPEERRSGTDRRFRDRRAAF